jgi:hypothetical protein
MDRNVGGPEGVRMGSDGTGQERYPIWRSCSKYGVW